MPSPTPANDQCSQTGVPSRRNARHAPAGRSDIAGCTGSRRPIAMRRKPVDRRRRSLPLARRGGRLRLFGMASARQCSEHTQSDEYATGHEPAGAANAAAGERGRRRTRRRHQPAAVAVHEAARHHVEDTGTGRDGKHEAGQQERRKQRPRWQQVSHDRDSLPGCAPGARPTAPRLRPRRTDDAAGAADPLTHSRAGESAAAASTERSGRTGIAHFVELAGVDVVDEATHRHRIGAAGRYPRMVEDRRHTAPDVPLQPLGVLGIAR